jgi:hypothetical protein
MLRAVLFSVFLLPVLLLAQATGYTSSTRFMMLMQPDVRKEIKLSKDQDKAIQEFLKNAQSNPSSMAGVMNMNMVNPAGALPEPVSSKFEASQLQRLEELFLQFNSGLALMDPAVAKALELTEEQSAKVNEIGYEAGAEVQKLMMNMRSQSAANKLKETRKAYAEKLLEILTAGQKAKFVEMSGKPFKFKN